VKPRVSMIRHVDSHWAIRVPEPLRIIRMTAGRATAIVGHDVKTSCSLRRERDRGRGRVRAVDDSERGSGRVNRSGAEDPKGAGAV